VTPKLPPDVIGIHPPTGGFFAGIVFIASSHIAFAKKVKMKQINNVLQAFAVGTIFRCEYCLEKDNLLN
jgi:hypothetical protein